MLRPMISVLITRFLANRSVSGMPRTFEEECKFIERVSECKFKIKKGFVPNMNVSCFISF